MNRPVNRVRMRRMNRWGILAIAAIVLAGCGGDGAKKSTVTLTPSIYYDCKDGTRLMVVDDSGGWIREKADGTDIAQGAKDGFWPQLDACKGK